jgi:2-oxoglutarate ferredoxin oxidoreductase subunit delta
LNSIIIDTERCKGCYLCIETCPKHMIEASDRPNAAGYYPARLTVGGDCIGCALCATVCPDVAIEVYREDKSLTGVGPA